MRRTLSLLPVALCAALVAPVPTRGEPGSLPPRSGAIEYNRDVRPILAENCFSCHGPDSAARKAKLRLDKRDEAIERGAIVPGKPAQSELMKRVLSNDPADIMPPPKSHKTLTKAQKDVLAKWIESGAEYQQHWSFLTSKRPAVPAVKQKEWVRNPIDAFVLAELEKSGLKPAPEADRRTLARRLAFDLTGLPPEPADVEAFVNDKSEVWYEKYVEKLMASPHWGEHRGRYWLDYARYADTHGIHFDNFREIWAYRDWVIDAFNANQPFDQFTIDQLAGDLLPNATVDQKVATGFNRCNITTNEGGVIAEEYVVLYARDRTETMSQVWMGLTTGCAVCHDHKYDPVSQRDFYSMSAFFNNTTQNAMDGNVHNTPPTIPVVRREDRPKFEQLLKDAAAAKAKVDARMVAAKDNFAAWLKTAKPEDLGGKAPTQGLVFHAPLTEGTGKELTVSVSGKERKLSFTDGYTWGTAKDKSKAFTIQPTGGTIELKDVGDFDRAQPFAVGAWVTITKRGNTGAIIGRMDEASAHRGWDVWIQQDKIGIHVINAYPQDAVKVVAKAPLQPNKRTHVTVAYDGTGKASGIKIYYDGEPQPFDIENDTLKSTTRTTVPLKIGQRHTTSRVGGIALDDLRVYDRAFTAIDAQQLAGSRRTADILAKPADKRTKAETDELFAWWLVAKDTEYRDLSAAYRKLQEEEVALRGRGTIAHIMNERPNSEPGAFVLFRGDYDKRRDPVKADTPKELPPMGKDVPRNRLGLAKWLVSKEHPLTTRVTVNRFWQELFGTGLVRTSGDFGIAGELPSHPALLDWLAIEFREPTPGLCCADPRPWDVKQFFKLLVTSATYRQAAVATPEKLDKDLDNRLLSRGPRFRMDAEMIRDNALAASGLLVRNIGGPSVKPYQPEGVWEAVAMIGSNTRDYRRDTGEALYRRSMYTFWKRSAPPASMEVLNAPNRETCSVRRDRTNTPLAALLTLNDVQFVEAARVLAEKTIAGGTTDDARIGFLSARLLSRPFRAAELAIAKQSLTALREHYKAKPEDAKKLIAFGESKPDAKLDAAELATWTMLANQLLNLDEVLNK
jgi:mono/diheme cytochrome c family protein